MRTVVLSLLASLAVASPALANEARVEARGGVIWDQGQSEAIAGVAAGYDWDLGSTTFVGVEASADKILTDNTRVSWGAGGRIGVKVLPGTKAYALADWESKNTRYGNSAVGVGGGVQQDVGSRYYLKAEYQHLLIGDNTPDADRGLVGVGVKF